MASGRDRAQGSGTPGPAGPAADAWTVLVAAGRGERFGGPKQDVPLAGRRLVDWSLDAARSATAGVVLVVRPEVADRPEPRADAVVAGGATRSDSVRAGLRAVPGDVPIVVVHDAARPVAGADLFAAVIASVRAGADAAVPGVPVVDTLRWRAGATVDRDALVAVQTPQAFRAPILRAAHAAAGEATDDASLVEAAGGAVVVVPGDPANAKVTHPADRAAAEAVLRARAGGSAPAGPASRALPGAPAGSGAAGPGEPAPVAPSRPAEMR